jgi:hypothetical protein
MEIKIKTLEQIHAAQDIIINALANPNLTQAEIKTLQDSSSKLRDMERSIVSLIGQTLVDSLTSDSTDLKNLVEEIKKSADKLAGVASGIEKAAGVVESFINIVVIAISAGIV